MSFPFNTITLPELTKEEMKILSAIIMQNSLIVMIHLQQTFMYQELVAVID